MRALWHLTTNSLAGRRWRTVLLVLAVALATALTVGVASAIGTMSRSIVHVVGQVTGLADLRVEHRFGERFDRGLLEEIRRWPEVELAAGRLEGGVTLELKRTGRKVTVLLRGVEPDIEEQLNPRALAAGRMVRSGSEVVFDQRVRRKLDAKVGDVLAATRAEARAELTVVGVLERPKLRVLQRRLAVAPLGRVQELAGGAGLLDRIDVRLRAGADAEAVAAARPAALPAGVVFRTSAAARAGVNRHLRWSKLLLYVLTVLASLSSGFLILTTLTTAVTQRTREMAILRCIGASRAQLAAAQVAGGSLVAVGGAAAGTPLGILVAYALYCRFQEFLPGGFHVNPGDVAVAVSGSLLAGLLGASYPAFLAGAARPLEALTVRARRPKHRHVLLCAAAGLVLASVQPVVQCLPIDGESAFWFWAYVGLPLTFAGVFLLSVPLLVLVARGVGPLLARGLGMPAALLRQSVLATPMRHGFTGGTLMAGLALLVSIWMQGRSATAGYLDGLKMPDAFVHSFWSLSETQWQALRSVEAATEACPAKLFPVRAVGMQLGLKELSPPNTLFVSTDMPAFLEMTDVDWHEGDRRTALRRLEDGRALLVGREWSVAHGVGVGTRLALKTLEGPVDFEVVGVVASRGLDLATGFFGIQKPFTDTAMSSVFGTRADAKRYFGVEGANLVLLSLREDVSDKEAIRQLTAAAPGSVAGTSRAIRRRVTRSLDRLMKVMSSLAVGSLVLACFGVGNLIVAEVVARRFEFGVLRAVGAQRGLLGRLVAGQTLLVALTGCVAGVMLGVEAVLIERVFHRQLMGIDYALHVPWDVIAWGALALIGAALVTALPAVFRVMRRSPRALLARQE